MGQLTNIIAIYMVKIYIYHIYCYNIGQLTHLFFSVYIYIYNSDTGVPLMPDSLVRECHYYQPCRYFRCFAIYPPRRSRFSR